MLSYSALTNHGKVTLPSMESWGTNMNIIKDPPRSIMMRRIDKVGDSNEILNMIDSSDRSAEAITRYARGVNPSVSVNYSNFGGSQQNFGNKQAFLPYTINKDGDFRPPVHAPQDLLALSRLPRNITHATTNPGMPHNLKELDNTRNQTVTNTVRPDIISAHVKSTKTYYLQKPFQEPFEMSKNSIQNVLNKNVNSNVNMKRTSELFVQEPTKGVNNDNLIVKHTQTNLHDVKHQMIDGDSVNTDKYIQDANTHSVYSNLGTAIDNGVPFDEDMFNLNNIKTKDYQLIEYTTPLSGNDKTQYIHENFELERNLPEYQSRTNTSGNGNISFIHDDIVLGKNLPEYQTHTNTNGSRKNVDFIHNDIVLGKNLPQYESRTNTNGTRKNTDFIHKELELRKNLPSYNSTTNNIGSAKVSFIHKNIELGRNLPEYQTSSNIKFSGQKNIKPEHVRELERKAVLSQFSSNHNRRGENNISARKYNLEEKIQPGGFENGGFIPVFDRTQEQHPKEKYESEKSKMSRNVINQISERYGR